MTTSHDELSNHNNVHQKHLLVLNYVLLFLRSYIFEYFHYLPKIPYYYSQLPLHHDEMYAVLHYYLNRSRYY